MLVEQLDQMVVVPKQGLPAVISWGLNQNALPLPELGPPHSGLLASSHWTSVSMVPAVGQLKEEGYLGGSPSLLHLLCFGLLHLL
jgi:hypothetical protein